VAACLCQQKPWLRADQGVIHADEGEATSAGRCIKFSFSIPVPEVLLCCCGEAQRCRAPDGWLALDCNQTSYWSGQTWNDLFDQIWDVLIAHAYSFIASY